MTTARQHMTRTERGWECSSCRAWMEDLGHQEAPPECDHSFPGYHVLRVTCAPALPGETLDKYHMRVYRRPYPHGERWPGTNLAGVPTP